MRVNDARGENKPGKEVAFHSRRGILEYDGPSTSYKTGSRAAADEGRTDIRVRAKQVFPVSVEGVTAGVEIGTLRDDVVILVGLGAREYSSPPSGGGGGGPAIIGDIIERDIEVHEAKFHVFTGSSLVFELPLSQVSWVEDSRTIMTVPMGVINERHYAILENHLVDPLLRGATGALYNAEYDPAPMVSSGHIGDDGEVDTNGDGVPDGREYFFAPLPSVPYAFGNDEGFTHDCLTDWFAGPFRGGFEASNSMTWRMDLRWHQQNSEEPIPQDGGESRAATFAAASAEFAVGFIPGGDLIFVVRDGFVYPLFYDEDNATNYISAGVSLAGVLADFGYLAGPTGLATNAAAGAARFVVRHSDHRVIVAVLKIGRTTVDSAQLVIGYMKRYKPTGWLPDAPHSVQEYADWTLECSMKFIDQWNGILASPIGLTADHIAGSTKVFALRMTGRTASYKAAEGLAGAVKQSGPEAVDDFVTKLTSNAAGVTLKDEAFDNTAAAFGRTLNDQPTVGGTIIDHSATRRVDEAIQAVRLGNFEQSADVASAISGTIGATPGKAFKSREHFEAMRRMDAPNMLPSQREAIMQARHLIPKPAVGSRITKVVTPARALQMATDGSGRLAGDLARAVDTDGLTTLSQLSDRLALDYPGSPFSSSSGMCVLETRVTADMRSSMKVPVSPGSGQRPGFATGHADEFPLEGENLRLYPSTGNGYTASTDGHLTPEWSTGGADMPTGLVDGSPGTFMKFMDAGGNPTPVLINGQSAARWKLVPDPNVADRTMWVPYP